MIERKSDSTVQEKVRAAEPCMWANLASTPTPPDDELGDEVEAAERRMARAAPLLRALFPSIKDVVDPLRSPLTPADALARALGESGPEAGRWFVKADHQLPIAGSVKARGGFHEVIALAERLAIEAGLLAPEDDLTQLASPEARELFGRYEVLVGSTGNLGMGIGLIASALGFKAVVHMSSDAKAWKKQRLRDHGVEVIEHVGDYAMAVANGRDAAAANPFAHFVDDEASLDLFVGYAAAARELQAQLLEAGVEVDAEHPLFVYIPCGVGGAPGGVTYGLKRVFGAHVHCVFAEPLQAPCMLVQLLAGVDQPVSVYDLGLTNKTEADGLAVGQASMLVAPLMVSRLAGIYTVPDDQLFTLVRLGVEAQGLEVEPSAAAAFAGPLYLAHTASGQDYLRTRNLSQVMDRATHVLWTTGGSLVPAKERAAFLAHPGAETARFELRTS